MNRGDLSNILDIEKDKTKFFDSNQSIDLLFGNMSADVKDANKTDVNKVEITK